MCELQREYPGWGRGGSRMCWSGQGRSIRVPSRMTVYRAMVRHGLVELGAQRRRRADYKCWQRDRQMQLWQMDIAGGVLLVNPVAGG